MLEETEKAISSALEISSRIKTTFFNLTKYMLSYKIQEYIIGDYAFVLNKKTSIVNYINFSHEAKLIKIQRIKKLFGGEKIIPEKDIYCFAFNIFDFKELKIEYAITNPLNVDEIQDAINFFLLFNEDIVLKAKSILEHKDELKAFDELLKTP